MSEGTARGDVSNRTHDVPDHAFRGYSNDRTNTWVPFRRAGLEIPETARPPDKIADDQRCPASSHHIERLATRQRLFLIRPRSLRCGRRSKQVIWQFAPPSASLRSLSVHAEKSGRKTSAKGQKESR